jgi:hypothetical protein
MAAADVPPRDFDFQIGSWNVHHRRLKERLAGSGTWEEFGGRCEMRTLMAGYSNVEDNIIEIPSGTYRAVALRSFDPHTESWAIWWLDGRSPHTLETPVIGRFSDGIGEFFASDRLRDRPIKVRLRWSNIQRDSCHWDQAFSPDDGQTWETNWSMRFTRS